MLSQKTIEKPKCIICNSQDMKLHFYPPNRFNDKEFHYYKCNKCSSLSIYPLPKETDFNLIYGVDDHTYLLKLKDDQALEFNFNYSNHNHQKYQLDFLKETLPLLKGKKLLDYACGSGFYMAYAKNLGLAPTGIEFNKDFADLLKEKTNMRIYSFKEFKDICKTEKFDIIHLGHILEHLINPKQIFDDLKKYTHNDTLFIIDGPLENNICLSRLIINLVSRIKKRKFNKYAPQHLSFTNYNSQLLFFNNLKMKLLKYKVVEQYWPFPEKPDWTSIKSIAEHLLARCSIFFSNIVIKYGNVFHYIGKFE